MKLSDCETEVRDAIRELAEENPDMTDPDYDGSLSEIVDGAIPVYTADVMELAADNISLATTEPELGPAYDGSPTPVNIITSNIYEHLSQVAWAEWEEAISEREEEEEEESPAFLGDVRMWLRTRLYRMLLWPYRSGKPRKYGIRGRLVSRWF